MAVAIINLIVVLVSSGVITEAIKLIEMIVKIIDKQSVSDAMVRTLTSLQDYDHVIELSQFMEGAIGFFEPAQQTQLATAFLTTLNQSVPVKAAMSTSKTMKG